MAVRIQLRRDTAENWVANNPVLRDGEIGIETDTLQFKIGNGSAWNSISNYANVVPSDLNTTLGDYVLVEDIGAQGGVVGLNNSYNAIIPGTSIILEGPTADSYETTLSVTDPTADRTIILPDADGTIALTSQLPTQYTDELAQDAVAAALAAGTHTNITVTYNDNANTLSLAAAPGYVDEQAVDAVAQALANGTHTNITVGYSDETNAISLTGAVTYTDENAQDAVGNALGSGLSYNDSTGAISVDTSAIQARVADVSDTEIGYLNGVTSGIQSQIDSKLATSTASSTYAPINNPTFTGVVTLPGAPTSANEAANKAYVDNTTAGLNFHAAVHCASTANLTATYDNGTAGFGATLTNSGTNEPLDIDNHTLNQDERVLIKDQTNQFENGIYVVTTVGDLSTPWVLTRSTDADNTPSGEIAYGDFTFVQQGTSGGYGYIMNTTGTITVGTSNISYTQFNAGQTVIAGNGLTEASPGIFAIDTTITADLSTAQTLTNKTLTSPGLSNPYIENGINFGIFGGGTGSSGQIISSTGTGAEWITLDLSGKQNVVSGVSDTEIGYLDGVTSAIQTQLDNKVDESLFDTKGDILVASADNTPAKLSVGTNGYLLTANSSATNGLEWAAAPISLPSQSGESGKYLTTDGTTASWGTVSSYLAPTIGSTSIASGSTVTSIAGLTLNATSSTSITSNTATTVDTNALSAFTTVKYVVSIKQGSKIRSSEIIAHTNGTSVDYAEFGVVETGGLMNGILVEAVASGSNCLLRVTITDAASTNATVKIQETLI